SALRRAASIRPPTHSERASASFSGGRGCSFGGISPALTRSSTVSQRSRAVRSAESAGSRSTREVPFGFPPVWHSCQYLTRNGRRGSSKWLGSVAWSGRAAAGPSTRSAAPRASKQRRLIRWQRRRQDEPGSDWNMRLLPGRREETSGEEARLPEGLYQRPG